MSSQLELNHLTLVHQPPPKFYTKRMGEGVESMQEVNLSGGKLHTKMFSLL